MSTKSGKGKSSSGAKSAKAVRKAPAKAPSKGAASAARTTKKAAKPAPKPATAKAAVAKAPAVKPALAKPPVAKPVQAKSVPAKPAPPKPAAPAVAAQEPIRVSRAKRRARMKEFERYRPLLLERQRELLEAYNLSKGDRRVHPDSGTEDYIDYAVSSYAKEFLLSLSEMDRKQLLLVKEALERLDRGEYGSCQQCGDDISPKRLEVAPWARYCLRCQDLDEQGLLPQYPSRLETDDGDEEEGEEAAPAEVEEDLEAEEVEELEEEPLGEADGEADDADE